MNILHITSTHIPNYNGTTIRHINLYKHSKHRHSFVVLNKKGHITSVHNALACKLPDVVQAHNPLFCALQALHCAKKYKLPLIYEIHRLFYDANKTGIWTKIPEIFHKAYFKYLMYQDKKVMDYASAIIVQGENKKQRLLELFNVDPNKIFIVPMGIPDECFQLSRNVRHGVSTKFLYAGALEKTNGIDIFMEALSRTHFVYIRPIIVGKGSFSKAVSQHHKVEYYGQVPYKDIFNFYDEANVIVVPNTNDKCWQTGASTKLLEAMASGRIVLASDTQGNKKFINDRTGVLFKSGDPDDLAEKMIDIINNFDKYKKRGEAASRKVKNLTWKRMGKKLDGVYECLKIK